MATETVLLHLSRPDSETPWGFRIQGGKDYSAPLIVFKVAREGIAENFGLREGDFLMQISGKQADLLSHKEAQQAIINSGNNLSMLVERISTRIWTPSVQRVDLAPGDKTSSPLKYSLAHDQPTQPHPESKYNVSAKPFGGSPGINKDISVKIATNAMQYNTPISLYSEKSANDAFKQQITTKNASSADETKSEEPAYLRSETLKLIQANEKQANALAPKPVPRNPEPPRPDVSAGLPQCHNCGRSIHGVFCKVADKPLHAECFVCSTCGSNLKNRGYFCIGSKVYCEIHAKAITQNQFKATPPVDPSVFAPSAPPLEFSPKIPDQSNAMYQPEILKKGPITHTPKTTSLSPASRGVPTYSPKTGVYTKPTGQGHESHELIGYPSHREASPTRLLASLQNVHLGANNGNVQKSPISGAQPKNSNPIDNYDGNASLKRGRGVLKQANEMPRIPECRLCRREIRGPFILALNKCWCPEHFVCSVDSCRRHLMEVGFVEMDDNDRVCCEFCYETCFAPKCAECGQKISRECLKAANHFFHPDCFKCSKCHMSIGKSTFYVENGKIYCESDWSVNFTTKCSNCQYPIESGDKYVEAMGGYFHSNCFACTICQKSLEGVTFYGKGGRPYCQNHT